MAEPKEANAYECLVVKEHHHLGRLLLQPTRKLVILNSLSEL